MDQSYTGCENHEHNSKQMKPDAKETKQYDSFH